MPQRSCRHGPAAVGVRQRGYDEQHPVAGAPPGGWRLRRRVRLRPLSTLRTERLVMTPSGRWPISVRLYLTSFLVVGMSLSVLGPALTELRDRSGADIGDIGVLFMGQSLGYICGSILGGRLYDRFDGHRVFAGALAILAVGLIVIPMFDTRAGMFVAFVITGLGASITDLGANALLMWELKAAGGRAMNLLHMFFGVGALLAPLLVYVGLARGYPVGSSAVPRARRVGRRRSLPPPGRPRPARSTPTPRSDCSRCWGSSSPSTSGPRSALPGGSRPTARRSSSHRSPPPGSRPCSGSASRSVARPRARWPTA